MTAPRKPGLRLAECSRCRKRKPLRADGVCQGCMMVAAWATRSVPRRTWTPERLARLRALYPAYRGRGLSRGEAVRRIAAELWLPWLAVNNAVDYYRLEDGRPPTARTGEVNRQDAKTPRKAAKG